MSGLTVGQMKRLRELGYRSDAYDLESLLEWLPRTVTRGDVYGIEIMIANEAEWQACYYSKFTGLSTDGLSYIAATPLEAAYNLAVAVKS